MNQNKGLYIVFEGAEGTGKTTQIELLAERLKKDGYSVRLFREPDSQSDLTARTIRLLTQDPRYPMNSKTEVLLYNAARSQSLAVIKTARDKGVICLVDRNYLSTLALQYYGRGDLPDYDQINNIINFAVGDMQPDLTIILDAPSQILYERVHKRGQGERFDDLEIAFLDRVRAGYLIEAKKRNLPVLPCVDSPSEIHEQVWNLIHGHSVKLVNIPTKDLKFAPAETTESIESSAPLIKKSKKGYAITPAGEDFLKKVVTDTKGNVYAFTDQISPLTAAAAMARLSRRFDDLRVTVLDEFAQKAEENSLLLKRVITAYGDDSVQQLVGLHVVVERASNLLTKKLEWGRLGAYLEQSTRYIYYDQKDKNGHYRYYVPENLNKKVKKLYINTLNQIFDKYSIMAHQATDYVRKNSDTKQSERDIAWEGATRAQACDAIRSALPVATQSTVGMYLSGQALESLVMHLMADELPEARTSGKKILAEGRKVIPAFLERADKPDRGGATIAYQASRKQNLKKLANKYLGSNNATMPEVITLLDYSPKNELDIVADMLYEYTNQPLQEIKQMVDEWPYKQKLKVFEAYMGERLNRRQKPGRALEKINYNWDILCDYGIFRDLQRHRMVNDLEWQVLTPRYGYDIPELVEQAGLAELFLDCFDLSLELYSALQAAGYETEAQYATLMGHKMRWKVSYNAREAFHLHELRTVPQGHPGYRKLVGQMHEQLLSVHPLIGEAMKFVNQDEDPELTRLAAERYTQYKLKILDKK